MEPVSPAFQERAVLFGRDRTLVGIACRSLVVERDHPPVIFINSGIIHRVGGNRIYVTLARALARIGVSSLRFDLAGVGDSWVSPDSPPMSERERSVIDIDDALEYAAGLFEKSRFVMAGLCSGADNALRSMGRDERVVGCVLLDLNGYRTRGYHLRRIGRGLRRTTTWKRVLTGQHPLVRSLIARASGAEAARNDPLPEALADTMLPDAFLPQDVMREHLERIVAQDGRILAIFTAGLEFQYNYKKQFLHMFPGLDFGRSLQLEYFGDSDHTFSRRHLQERLIRIVTTWIQGR